MRIEVGRTYRADMPNEPEFRGSEWIIQIVAEVQKNGTTWFVGLVNKGEPGNLTTMLFDTDGHQPGMDEHDMGMRLLEPSRAKPQWTVKAPPVSA